LWGSYTKLRKYYNNWPCTVVLFPRSSDMCRWFSQDTDKGPHSFQHYLVSKVVSWRNLVSLRGAVLENQCCIYKTRAPEIKRRDISGKRGIPSTCILIVWMDGRMRNVIFSYFQGLFRCNFLDKIWHCIPGLSTRQHWRPLAKPEPQKNVIYLVPAYCFSILTWNRQYIEYVSNLMEIHVSFNNTALVDMTRAVLWMVSRLLSNMLHPSSG
jgi:hypothetical protein